MVSTRTNKTQSSATAERLNLVNRMALADEPQRAITFPASSVSNPESQALLRRFKQLTHELDTESAELEVWSFDMDLTLAMPEDEPGCRGPVPINYLHELQQHGCIVGSCSDREPSEQRAVLSALGFNPDFCIPKEMLRHLAQLLPDAQLTHVGDDELRDRRPALAAGWRHLWPHEVV